VDASNVRVCSLNRATVHPLSSADAASTQAAAGILDMVLSTSSPRAFVPHSRRHCSDGRQFEGVPWRVREGSKVLAWCAAAIGLPVLAGALFDRTGSYVSTVWVAAGVNVLGMLVAGRLPAR